MKSNLRILNEGFDRKYSSEVNSQKNEEYNADDLFMGSYEDLDECGIGECLNELNEAEMSAEDKADSEVLRNIYNKSVKRSNAKLTPEEKKVLTKYGLRRDEKAKIVPDTQNDWGNAVVRPEDDDSKRRGSFYRGRYHFEDPVGMSNDKINLADRARKYVSGQRSPYTYGHQGGVNALKRDRERQNAEMQANYNQMSSDLWSRNYHKDKLGNIDSTADNEIKKLQDRIAALQRKKETDRSYHAGQLDRYQGRINKALRKEECLKGKKGINEELSFDQSSDLRSDVYNALAGVMFDWQGMRNIPVTESDLDKAIEWFQTHFWESDDYLSSEE